MPRKKPINRTALLLLLCLMVGAAGSPVWAETEPGAQLVLVLDFSNPPEDKENGYQAFQVANLLVHLLGDHSYLGLFGSEKPEGVILPLARLDSHHRHQALDKLRQVKPSLEQQSLDQIILKALEAFQSRGPKRRVLFWLTGRKGTLASQQNRVAPSDLEKIAAQARSAGVRIFAAGPAPMAEMTVWQTLTSATGGRLWEVPSVDELHGPCLKLYQYVEQPQEAPISGSQVLLDKWVKRAILLMTRLDSKKAVVLTDPRKVSIIRSRRGKNLRWIEGSAYDLITLTHPQPGVWSFAGARPEVCKAFLSTKLSLTVEGIPSEVGKDEALRVTAAFYNNKETRDEPDLFARTQFRAELQFNNTLWAVPLDIPRAEDRQGLTPEVRVGRFAALHQEGEGTLKILALGETFQRLRSLPITVTPPWFQVRPPTDKTQALLPLHFKPDPDRHPERLGGAVTLKSPQGSLGGVFIKPAPMAEIILANSPGGQDYCLADMQLTGIASGGRLLEIATGPVPLKTSQEATEISNNLPEEAHNQEKVQVTNSWTLSPKIKRRWVWLGLSSMGFVVLLASAFLLWRLRPKAGGLEDGEDFTSHKSILRLKAQVEALAKEKAALEDIVNGKNKELEHLMEEKTELQEDLERIQKKHQDNLRTLGELEKRLEKAEQEAKGVNQEYMALYARNQQEKDLLKKT